ncbi:type II toxin-antitoxin system PemK/MazF family toxin [Azospirillum sp. B4]|uniref:type II toxin-antitoxin system PemK/MazF family toxin n=1 Tax=Azospirillum sp. B4 TaxID=95605 RepID=UPI0003493DD8|nr:type II toxin-antitoxin system PemK/MazF family toxin [Azospirillum sp. B4]
MERGEIWHVDLDPTKGREEAKPRYVLILTPRDFNQLGTPVVAPITTGGNFARERGFAVSLSGAGTNATGVILCNQIRALDMKARNGRFSEQAPDFIVDDVLARVSALFE